MKREMQAKISLAKKVLRAAIKDARRLNRELVSLANDLGAASSELDDLVTGEGPGEWFDILYNQSALAEDLADITVSLDRVLDNAEGK